MYIVGHMNLRTNVRLHVMQCNTYDSMEYNITVITIYIKHLYAYIKK